MLHPASLGSLRRFGRLSASRDAIRRPQGPYSSRGHSFGTLKVPSTPRRAQGKGRHRLPTGAGNAAGFFGGMVISCEGRNVAWYRACFGSRRS